MNQEQLLKEYLTNKTRLYQDWYREISLLETDPNMRPIARVPSMPELKARFNVWFQENKQTLIEVICVKWGYPLKKDTLRKTEALIMALAVDVVTVTFSLLPRVALLTTTILVVEGYLETLCADCAKQE